MISPRNDTSAGPGQEVVVKDANAEAWVTNGAEEWISLGDPICV